MSERADELDERTQELWDDKWGLPKFGQRGTVESHVLEWERKQKNLQKLIQQFEDKECEDQGLKIPSEIYEKAYMPIPSPLNDYTPMPWNWTSRPNSNYTYLPFLLLIPFPGNPIYAGL